MTSSIKTLLFIAICSLGCTSKQPIVAPTPTVECKTPYYGADCMDAVDITATFSHGLPCNLCQQDGDGPKEGCVWKAQKIWCTQNCNECSALNGDFIKK